MKYKVHTLPHRFKRFIKVAFDLFNKETYFFDNAQIEQSPTQYVYAIMRYNIGYNIVNIPNQLFFAY